MKYLLSTLIFSLLYVYSSAQWRPAGDKIKTKWAENVSPENAWQEYPRPQFERGNWINLNGLTHSQIANSKISNKTTKRPVIIGCDRIVSFMFSIGYSPLCNCRKVR